MKELILAFLIFTIICFLAAAHKMRSSDQTLVYVVDQEEPQKYINPSPGDAYAGGSCGDVRYESKPYHAYDNCMASCGECNAYNTEPILREMTFYNNL